MFSHVLQQKGWGHAMMWSQSQIHLKAMRLCPNTQELNQRHHKRGGKPLQAFWWRLYDTYTTPFPQKQTLCCCDKLAQRTSSIMTVSTNLVETDGMSLKRSWCGTMHMNLLAYQPLFWGKVIKSFNRFSLDVTGDCYHEVFMYQWPLKVELRLSLNLFR